MANILSDNTVIPSYLGNESRGGAPGSTAMLNDFVLRFGEVKRLIYPTDPSSYSKKSLEYEIEVQYREGDGIYTTSLYRGVTATTMFGGSADKFFATFRPDANPEREDSDVGDGSKVLILCVSGDQQKAIILGALRDPADKKTSAKADGHNLFWEFNGIRFEINKDGEATLTFRGATKSDGELNDKAVKDAEGTKMVFDKEGDFTVSTPKDKQIFKINNKDKKIEITADEEWHALVNGKLNFEVQKDVNVATSGGKMDLGASSNIFMKSAGVHVGGASDAWVKGTTYRQSESVMHNLMQSALGTLNGAGGTLAGAGASLTAAGGIMVIPIAGAIIAGPAVAAAGASIIAASASIIAAATMLTSAIATFEGASATYLSMKNKTD